LDVGERLEENAGFRRDFSNAISDQGHSVHANRAAEAAHCVELARTNADVLTVLEGVVA
jgi:hypothetical protein